MSSILVIDDSFKEFQPGLRRTLNAHTLFYAPSGSEGLNILQNHAEIALVLLDIKMPVEPEFGPIEERQGIEVLKRIRLEFPHVYVVMLSVMREIDLVVEAIQLGAYHYVPKPIDRDKLRNLVDRVLENAYLKQENKGLRDARVRDLELARTDPLHVQSFHGMVGEHPEMQKLYAWVACIGEDDPRSVLIQAESGTGKELVAKALHTCSARREGPFIAHNCATFTDTLADSTLFGHMHGSFTGASDTRTGLIERAHGGTLFLDEIAELPPAVQSKLLRAMQEKTITPVGGTEPRKIDVRFVCATNRNLIAAREEGTFRSDLFWRIAQSAVLPIPPLRERLTDIPLLCEHFLAKRRNEARGGYRITEEARDALMRSPWPGNVRQLENFVGRLALLCRGGDIGRDHVDQAFALEAGVLPEVQQAGAEPAQNACEGAREEMREVEEDFNELPEVASLSHFKEMEGMRACVAACQRALERASQDPRKAQQLLRNEESLDTFQRTYNRYRRKIS